MIFIGIDPGLDGAVGAMSVVNEKIVAAVADSAPIVTVKVGKREKREPNAAGMARLLSGISEGAGKYGCRAVLEKVGPHPKEGVSAVASLARGYGMWEGILAALGIPYQLVTPQAWKKSMGLIGKAKDDSRIMAQRMFPDVELPLKKDHGRAEALLLAEYLRREYGLKGS